MKKNIIIVFLLFIILILLGIIFNIFSLGVYKEKIIINKNYYIDEFPKKYDFSSKRVFIEGDSIQAGSGKFLEKTCFLLDTKYPVNKSVSGATLAYRKDSNNTLYHRIIENEDLDFKEFDVVLIAAGINDYDMSIPVGNYNSINKDESSGALNLIINKIHDDNKNAKIIIFTPMYRFKNGKNQEMVKNATGLSLKTYRNTLKKVGGQDKYKEFLYVIDGDKLSHPDEYLNMTIDGLHPTEELASIISKRASVKLSKLVY